MSQTDHKKALIELRESLLTAQETGDQAEQTVELDQTTGGPAVENGRHAGAGHVKGDGQAQKTETAADRSRAQADRKRRLWLLPGMR